MYTSDQINKIKELENLSLRQRISDLKLCEANRLSSTIGGNREMDQLYTDVTSVKYNKEKEIFSHQLTWFPRLNKKV